MVFSKRKHKNESPASWSGFFMLNTSKLVLKKGGSKWMKLVFLKKSGKSPVRLTGKGL